MKISKNTYGVSHLYDLRGSKPHFIKSFGGSCLDRNNSQKEKKSIPKMKPKKEKTPTPKSMSKRTRSKIRQKLFALSRINDRLTFLTLTFVNDVKDETAIKILRTFLDNAKKRLNDFQYLWVAERQSKNEVFQNNIHFHLVTNTFWNIKKWWPYWLETQAKFGIIPRDENFKPTSAFNIKSIKTSNAKQVGNYLTKYITKNSDAFNCQVWNCSKKISRLYTCFYSGIQFINDLERLESDGLLGDKKLKAIPSEYCTTFLVPLNKVTLKLYNSIDDKNKEVWATDEKGGVK